MKRWRVVHEPPGRGYMRHTCMVFRVTGGMMYCLASNSASTKERAVAVAVTAAKAVMRRNFWKKNV